ncbi:MAG: type II toxin-antitoxin system RelE/ParE family toxin [Candidatus Bathyarchaeota archaeon]|uniref:type II toxin-antitoxin system RelE family toxin n=1 Tax=Candidatus Bathycorpusculum sp. TaxID=2994959 RepID=UPI002824313F|nr:type II toxin-antitoxin system RelE/ParE family toxin [Candidatus Termiticorpusculum sp.]MCL2258038.1 type II toxin-antitoxin system RelE/ParE family toxin [Candidatus Termiticorpusculum sp.]MCL2291740.1 type II toxin-antitoxin system RelE/ParE family toxin [Candidatus Termiticorpusculum sp.]
MYSLEIEEQVSKAFHKLLKKDRVQLEAINKKIQQILSDPYQFKPLKHPLEGLRRTHIGSFVLIYKVNEKPPTIQIIQYTHHDKAYL